MSAPIDTVLPLLDKVRNRQPGQWSCRCPAHDDNGPSLSVRETPDGAVLLHCFAGCEVSEVLDALGLDMQALFPPREQPTGAPARTARLLTAPQALELLADESMLIAMAAHHLSRGQTYNESELHRLRLAAGRVNLLHHQYTGGNLHA